MTIPTEVIPNLIKCVEAFPFDKPHVLSMAEKILLLDALAELLAVREAQPVVEVKPYGYLRENNGQVQISIGPERPADRSGGYATPWGAIYAATPAPAVTVNFKALAKDLVENLVDCGGADDEAVEQYLAWAEKTCRAAMLNHSGDSNEKVPAGFKLVPIDLINDLRNAAHFEKASYAASFGSHIDTGRWKDEYEQLTATCKAVDELLAAAPTPTKAGE